MEDSESSSPDTRFVIWTHINHPLRLLQSTLASVFFRVRVVEDDLGYLTTLVNDAMRNPKRLEDFDRSALEA